MSKRKKRQSKPWPEKGTLNFRDIVEPVYHAIRFAYDLHRKNEKRSIPWEGYNIGEAELVIGFPPHEKLRYSNLMHDEHEQDRDALQVLIGIAVQLGIEQGRRIEQARYKTTLTKKK